MRRRRTSKAGPQRLPPARPPAPAPLDELEAARAARLPSEEDKIREQRELVDLHRAQRSEQLARHTRETAELLDRHRREEQTQAHDQQRELAQLYRRHGREPSGFQLRILGDAAAWTGGNRK